ncbi:helix-turn-helix domain-containing protein, partial [Patulibacter sp. NPDC049589]|uniref:helix-turn-helix domain-containing protein n=1 Tax=Patulibacter sp. NPDC049589 TaxID=3154731 RepID=UPI00343992ED
AARAVLLVDLLGERPDDAALAAAAVGAGLAPGTRRLVVVLAGDDGDAIDAGAVAPVGWGAVAVPLASGPVLVVDVPEDVATRDAGRIVRDRLVACAGPASCGGAISPPYAGFAGLRRGLREARAAARMARTEPIVVQDLGPARLLVTAPEDAPALGEELLGPLLHPEPGIRDLLTTLETFLASGASVTVTAAELGLHANSIRHRFGRIRAATGLDVIARLDDQLLAQAGLAALRLGGPAADGGPAGV